MTLRRFAYLCFTLALIFVSVATTKTPVTPRTAQHASAETTFDPASATTTPGYYTVMRVVDGDTIIVWKEGRDVTVRLLGMDTPEVVDPRKPVECYGPEASAEGKKLLSHTDVRLVPDPSQDTYDKYGRELAYVYLPSGFFYNEFMIAEGYAHEYTYKKAYEFQKEFKVAQAEAKSAQKGFWSPTTCNGDTGITSGKNHSTP